MGKRVWFVSHYSMPPEIEKRVKTLRWAHYFNEWGYETKIFAASTLHDYKDNLIKDGAKYIERNYGDLDFVHINCMDYGSNHIKRIINHHQFATRFAKIAKNFEKPDIIVATDLNCINYKPIVKFCKKNNIKLIADIRDLWPLSFVSYLNISERNPIIKHLFKRERQMYMMSDAIVFVMEGGYDYIKDRGWDNAISSDKVYYINNGVDIQEFYDSATKYVVNDVDLDNPESFKVIYTGSIRKANKIQDLIDVAVLLEQEAPNIKIIIYGNGNQEAAIAKSIDGKRLSNILLKGYVDKNYIPGILMKSDINLLSGGADELFKYGIGFNKLFEYLTAGKPIIGNFNMSYSVLSKYNCGLSRTFADSREFADTIKSFYNLPEGEYNTQCENALKASKDFDYELLSKKLKAIVDALLEN